MPTLAEQIEALRVRLFDSHANELHLATRLKVEIAERDAELLREITATLEVHDHRRRDIARALHILAQRIGHLPRLEAAPVSPTLVTGGGPGATQERRTVIAERDAANAERMHPVARSH
jgi:hypothetical protein